MFVALELFVDDLSPAVATEVGGEAKFSSILAVSAIDPDSSVMRFEAGSGILNETSLRLAQGKNSASNSMLPVYSRECGSGLTRRE